MITYTYEKAKQNLSTLLAKSVKEGLVRIKNKNGEVFVVKPEKKLKSPLDVKGVDLGIKTDEIIKFIHDGRKTI